MTLVCPECKNAVDLSRFPGLAQGQVIECDQCGITLLVRAVAGETVTVEIVDEGK